MITMTEGLIVFVSLVIIAAVVMMITGIKKRRKEDKVHPYICFGEKIFLKEHEIAQFERASRTEKRKALNSYRARIKRGQIVPVYKGGEIIGYVPNREYNG